MVVVDDYAFIKYAFENLPVFKGEEAKLALDMAFDTFFGLQRMDQAAQRPLLSIAVSPLEEYGTQGALYKALDTYARSSVGEIFPSLSIAEYMDLPRETRDYILTISEKLKAEKYQLEQDALTAAGLGKNGKLNLSNTKLK